MTTITVKVPGKAKARFSALVKELGGEIISVSTANSKKSKILNEIKAGLKDVQAIREGKASSYTMSDL